MMGSRVHPVTADSQSNTSALQQRSALNDSSIQRHLQANIIAIPTALYKRKQKASDKPGFPTGSAISARMVFNRMYREKLMATSEDTNLCDDYPVYMELANAVKDNIRSFLYQDIGLKRGERTYTSVKIEYGSQLMQLKRRIVGRFPVLAAAQNYWIVTEFIKESMQRDKKSLVEANKRGKRASVQTHQVAPGRQPDPVDASNESRVECIPTQRQRRRACASEANRTDSVRDVVQGSRAYATNNNRATNDGTQSHTTKGSPQHEAMKIMSETSIATAVRNNEQQGVTIGRVQGVSSESLSIRAAERNREDEQVGSASRRAQGDRKMDRHPRPRNQRRTGGKNTSGKRRASKELADSQHHEYESDEILPLPGRQQKYRHVPAKKKLRRGSRSMKYVKPLLEIPQSDEEETDSGSEEVER